MISRQLLLQLPDFYLYNCKSRFNAITYRAHERDSKGTVFLWQSPEAAPLVGWGVGQSPTVTKALRKGEFQKQSGGLFLKEGRLASEGVPKRDVEDAVPYIFQRADNIRPYKHKSDLLHMILFSAKGNI